MPGIRRVRGALVSACLGGLLLGCGRDSKQAAPAAGGAAGGGGDQLTAFEMENGIGPVKEAIALGPLDHEMAEAGKALFESKCSACHKMSERYVGPALGEVTVRRTPAYIMNMVLNPEEMYTRHPVAHQLLAELMTQMPNLGLTRDQARQIVEYLRTQAPAKAAS